MNSLRTTPSHRHDSMVAFDAGQGWAWPVSGVLYPLNGHLLLEKQATHTPAYTHTHTENHLACAGSSQLGSQSPRQAMGCSLEVHSQQHPRSQLPTPVKRESSSICNVLLAMVRIDMCGEGGRQCERKRERERENVCMRERGQKRKWAYVWARVWEEKGGVLEGYLSFIFIIPPIFGHRFCSKRFWETNSDVCPDPVYCSC